MGGENLVSGVKLVEAGIGNAASTEADRSTIKERSLIFQNKASSTTIFVSPSSIIAEYKDNLLYIPNTSLVQIRLDDKGLEIISCQGNKKLTLSAGDGGIIFKQNSPELEQTATQVIEGKSEEIPYRMTKTERSILKGFTFGQTLKYFIDSSDLTKPEIVEGFETKDSTVNGYIYGKRVPRKVPNFEKIFHWKQNDPRVQILKAKYQIEFVERKKRERMKREMGKKKS